MRLLILLVAAACAASAQAIGTFQCKVSADAPLLRAGGLAELLGEIRFDCTGDTGRGAFLGDIEVILPSAYSGKVSGQRAEALLLVGDPATPVLGETVYPAVNDEPEWLRFRGVRIPSPGAGNLRLRIVNLRVAAIAPSAATSKFLTVSFNANFPLDTQDVVAGFITAGVRFQRLAGAVRFDEGFAGAFRKRNVATAVADPAALAAQNEYGRDYGTETGFYAPAIGDAGLATQGTRVMASFANVPPGAAVLVSYAQAAGSSASIQARLVGGAPDASGMVALLVTGGVAQAVWEVYASDPAEVESLQFTVSTTATNLGASGRFAPDSEQEIPDASSQVPRFTSLAEPPVETCGVSCLLLPESVAVTYTQGAAAPGPLVIPVRSSGAALAWRAAATAAGAVPAGVEPPDAPWLSVAVAAGTTPSSLTVNLDPAALAPGVYQGRVVVTSGRFQRTVLVVLTVRRNPSSAPVPFCQLRRDAFTPLRNTGITERLNDMLLICEGTGAPVVTDLRVELDTTITSRPNDVLLLVNDPAPAAQVLGVNVFRASRVSSTAVVFPGLTLPAAGATLRIVNLFVDASRPRPRFQPGIGIVTSRVRASAANVRKPYYNAGQTEAVHTFSVLNTGGGWRLQFTETEGDVFRPRTANGLLAQSAPGFIYHSETGFYNPALPNSGGVDMGLATQGTRLMARFSGVPAGVALAVSVNEIGAAAGSPRAQLVRTDANGAGAYQAVAGPFAPIALTNGSGIAVWEVLRSDWIVPENLQFTLQVTGPYTPAVEGLLAPLSTIDTADAAAPLPRFVTAPVTRPPCPSFPCLRLPASIALSSVALSATVLVGADAGPVPFLVEPPTVPWLRVSPGAATTPCSFTVTAVPDGLAAGLYSTSIIVNGASIPVTLNAGDAGAPALLLPSELVTIAMETGSGFLVSAIEVAGTPNLRYDVSSNAPWLQVTSGFAVPYPAKLRIDASLPPGVYETVVTFTAANVPAVNAVVRVNILPRPAAHTITGTITSATGTPLAGVVVELSGSGSGTAVTAANGVYSFTGLSGGDFQVTPSSGTTVFSPSRRRFSVIPLVQTANFTVARGAVPSIQLTPQPLTVQATDSDGVTNLRRVYFLVNTAPTIAPCHGYFDRGLNAFYLYIDALTAVLGPLTPGSSGVIENSQCRLLGAGSTSRLLLSGELEVSFGVARKGAFAASAQKVYFQAQDLDGNETGWVYASSLSAVGSTAPVLSAAGRPPAPALAEGALLTLSDPDGPGDLARAYFLLNDSTTITPGVCHGFYDFAARAFYLYDDSLTKLQGPLAPSGLLENGQCAMDGATSAATPAGQITLSLTRFGGARGRAQKLFVWITDRTNLGTGWLDTGLAYPAMANTAPSIVSASSAVTGLSQRHINGTIRDTDSPADISRVYFLMNPTPTIAGATCHGFYDRPSGALYLYNDSLTALIGPLKYGSSLSVENSQCRLSELYDNTLYLNNPNFTLGLTFTRKGASAAGNTSVYFWAVDAVGNGTGWIPVDSWTVNNKPTIPVSTPPTVSGLTYTFSLPAEDGDSYADLQRLYFLFNPTPTIPQNTCHGFYDRPQDAIYLYNDNFTVLQGPMKPGSGGTLENGQCTIRGAGSTVIGGGVRLTFNLRVTFNGAFSNGPQNGYVWAVDQQNNGTGWVQIAAWNGRGPNQLPFISAVPTTFASGSPSAVTFSASDPDGPSDIARLYFLLGNVPLPQAKSCYGYYDRAANAVFLYNDALTGVAPSPQNSQCSIEPSSLRVANGTDGLTLSVTVTMSLNGAFGAAQQTIWTRAVDSQNGSSSWTPSGTWMVNRNRPPSLVWATPASVTGSSATVSIFADDPDGWTNVARIYFLLADAPVIGVNSCHGYYDRGADQYWLYDDALSALVPSSVNSNGQCEIAAPPSPPSRWLADTSGQFYLPVTLRGAYAGTAKKLYVWIVDQQGNGTGWVQAARFN